jgi:uncharacterized protein (TIGR02246 family)
MKNIILTSMLVLSSIAVVAQPKADKTDTKSDEQAIRSVSKKWLELTKSHDAAGCAALFADDGVEYRENQEPFVGPEAVRKQITMELTQNPKEQVDWSTERVEVSSSGDLATEYGKFNVTGLGKNGTESDYGKYITVYRKVNGVWKVAADIGTSTKPLPAAK